MLPSRGGVDAFSTWGNYGDRREEIEEDRRNNYNILQLFLFRGEGVYHRHGRARGHSGTACEKRKEATGVGAATQLRQNGRSEIG